MSESCPACTQTSSTLSTAGVAFTVPSSAANTFWGHICEAVPMLVGHKARISRIGNGQVGIYLPKAVREALGVEFGMEMEFVVTGRSGGFFRIVRGGGP